MRLRRAAESLLVAVTLAACGGPHHGPADSAFVSRMIPHHELGMELINEATLHSDDVELRRLVFEMSGYHHDELAQLHEWAHAWGTGTAQRFPGRIDEADLTSLAGLKGPGHDTWWLALMIRHHRGAVDIAGEEIRSGTNRDAVAMAHTVLAVQQRQITDMEHLLRGYCAATPGLKGCG